MASYVEQDQDLLKLFCCSLPDIGYAHQTLLTLQIAAARPYTYLLLTTSLAMKEALIMGEFNGHLYSRKVFVVVALLRTLLNENTPENIQKQEEM